ncbi:tripartite tricarboxylate transporter permease [Halorussus aquaticus]|uniref:Tripartite tricarboxylate transporter permease n=1 Tax=Halorussus aquaticus TaxID=2953748 RepID=A0ABD5PYT2_9EURY|nr:tripartite tricarboxylate transporter permease [Halorussus aquaticus]
METLGVRLAFGPVASATALAFVFGGVALGTVSGLTPGLHVNNLALLLASVAPAVPGPPRLVGAAMLAAGVVHSFLDAVPALALGVPDAAMAATALPGHRLVIAGRGREAVRLSALGSGLAVAFAVPLAVPVTHGMTVAYPVVRAHLPVVLGVVVAVLLLTEGSVRAFVGGVAAFLGSATLGHATLDLSPAAPLDAGGMLTPLFAGLFGAPVLLEAASGSGVPEQDDATVATSRRTVAVTALAGSVAGAVVGYLPGVSAAVAAVLALAVLPGSTEARGFVVATSGVNTANTVFALFALAALGTPRTGVMVALREANAPVNLPLLLATAGIAGVAGFLLVLGVGDRYLRTVGALDQLRLSTGVLVLLAGLSWSFAGLLGVVVLGVATLVGLVPARYGARRVHLMGVLLGPLIVGT